MAGRGLYKGLAGLGLVETPGVFYLYVSTVMLAGVHYNIHTSTGSGLTKFRRIMRAVDFGQQKKYRQWKS